MLLIYFCAGWMNLISGCIVWLIDSLIKWLLDFRKNLEKYFSPLRNWLVSAGIGGSHYSCKIFSAGGSSNRIFFFDRNCRLWNYAYFFLLWLAPGSGEFCKRVNKLENAPAYPDNYIFVLPLDCPVDPTALYRFRFCIVMGWDLLPVCFTLHSIYFCGYGFHFRRKCTGSNF